MYPSPSYTDGLNQVVALSVFCYNNGATYTTYSGDPSEGAQKFEARNSNNQLIGSVTFIDGRVGTLNCQYTLIADERPGATNLIRPGYIVSFRERFYVVGECKTPIEKNQIIKFSCQVTELQNPFIPNLLTVLGQQKSTVIASASLPTTVSAAASGTRSTAVIAYTLETFATQGSAAPTGISINASTGLVTVANTVTAGTYDVRAIASDTITLPDGTTSTIYGWGRWTITVT
jgi:hypothetical protein